eukprot:3514881-Pyramimonas_sp.AAC.1
MLHKTHSNFGKIGHRNTVYIIHAHVLRASSRERADPNEQFCVFSALLSECASKWGLEGVWRGSRGDLSIKSRRP